MRERRGDVSDGGEEEGGKKMRNGERLIISYANMQISLCNRIFRL